MQLSQKLFYTVFFCEKGKLIGQTVFDQAPKWAQNLGKSMFNCPGQTDSQVDAS